MSKTFFNTSLTKTNIQTREFILQQIEEYLKPKDSIILEIGIGNGRFGILLANKFKEYLGIDADPEYVQLAKRNIPRRAKIRYKEGKAEKIPFNKKVDVLLYANVWHFIKDFNSAIKEAKRILKNKGIIIILEPSKKTKKWASPKLNKNSPEFNLKIYKKKIKSLANAEIELKKQKELKIIKEQKIDFLGSNFYLLKTKI